MKSVTLLHIKDTVIKEKGNNLAVFEISALYPGFGITLGNALRRTLYSSIPGAAITSVKIKGASHEFSTIPGILEDVLEITLNLKSVAVRIHGQEAQIATLKVKGQKEVTAKDIDSPSQVEIANGDAHIATLTDKSSSLEMEFTIESGMGYQAVEDRVTQKADIGTIPLDAVFTPVRKVNFTVQDMRVGDKTDYNRLTMDVETNGTVSPTDAFAQALDVLVSHFSLISSSFAPIENTAKEEGNEGEEGGDDDITKDSISDFDVSLRSRNLLIENGIKTVGGLMRKEREDILSIEGMGEKAVVEIEKVLKKNNVALKE